MSGGTNRSVSLPSAELDEFRKYADQQGISLAGWLLAAARRERARQSARAYADLLRDPSVAAEVAAHREDIRRTQAGRDARLLTDAS